MHTGLFLVVGRRQHNAKQPVNFLQSPQYYTVTTKHFKTEKICGNIIPEYLNWENTGLIPKLEKHSLTHVTQWWSTQKHTRFRLTRWIFLITRAGNQFRKEEISLHKVCVCVSVHEAVRSGRRWDKIKSLKILRRGCKCFREIININT